VFSQQTINLVQKFLMALGANWVGKVTGRYTGDESVGALLANACHEQIVACCWQIDG